MRLAWALVAVLAAAPLAQAASFETPERTLAAPIVPGGDARFEVPVRALESGSLYVKLLPTPSNDAHDGARANGSYAAREGWWVLVSARRADGTATQPVPLVDTTRSELIPVAAGEDITFHVEVHAPREATQGTVILALAMRPGAAASGQGSGGTLDASRALTLRLTATSASAAAPTPAGPTPAPPPVVDASPTPAAATPPSTPASRETQPTASLQNGGATTAADPRASTFEVVALVLLGAIVILLSAGVTLLGLVLRELRAERAAQSVRRVEVRAPDAPAHVAPERPPPRE